MYASANNFSTLIFVFSYELLLCYVILLNICNETIYFEIYLKNMPNLNTSVKLICISDTFNRLENSLNCNGKLLLTLYTIIYRKKSVQICNNICQTIPFIIMQIGITSSS